MILLIDVPLVRREGCSCSEFPLAFSVKRGSKSARDIAQHRDTHSSHLALDIYSIALTAELIMLDSINCQWREVIIIWDNYWPVH